MVERGIFFPSCGFGLRYTVPVTPPERMRPTCRSLLSDPRPLHWQISSTSSPLVRDAIIFLLATSTS